MIVFNDNAKLQDGAVFISSDDEIWLKKKYLPDVPAVVPLPMMEHLREVSYGKGRVRGIWIGTGLWFAVDAVILICRKAGLF